MGDINSSVSDIPLDTKGNPEESIAQRSRIRILDNNVPASMDIPSSIYNKDRSFIVLGDMAAVDIQERSRDSLMDSNNKGIQAHGDIYSRAVEEHKPNILVVLSHDISSRSSNIAANLRGASYHLRRIHT